jgi:CheY-like chemotaxis protein
MTLEAQPFALDRLLRDLSVIFSASVGNKPVEVLFDIDPRVPRELVGDSLRLQQILINLGGNAIKFTSRGEVVLGVRLEAIEGEGPEQRARVRFAVKDSGIGIAPENQEKIFTGFSQAEASTTRRFGGSGLGLSICRRLVEMMGSELELHSALGQGSTFSFTLRLPILNAEPDHLALPPPDQATGLAPQHGMPVLVVDDNLVARELMLTMGQSLGWAVEIAGGGEAALALIEERTQRGEPYQAVFMDWQMPGMDGWQTSARIRSQALSASAAATSPVIMMVTAHGREMLAQQTAEVQNLLDGYLVKPVTASMLFDAMQDAKPPSGTVEAASGKRTPSEVARPLAGIRLLVVEDNAINQEVAEALLSGQGAAVDIAENGLRGVEAVQAAMAAGKPYQVVLMDMQMPVMDGLTATREIRRLVNAATLPIIAMTANAMASDRETCLEAGMNDHVGKPFDLDHLVATLLQWTRGQKPPAVAHESATRDSKPKTEAAREPAPVKFPHVAGIEAEGTAARLNHDLDLFIRVLGWIANDFTDLLQLRTAADVAPWLAAPEARKTLTERIHKLRGSAGSVGAREVLNSATVAERALLDGAGDGVQRVLELNAALSHLVRGIQDMLAAQQASSAPASAASAAAPVDQAAVARLAHLLNAQDLAALSLYTEQKASLGAAMGGDAAGELERAMQALDFAQAFKLLQVLTQP